MHRDIDFAAAPAAQVAARIVACGRAGRLAFAPHVTLELVEHPVPVAVPGMARHACGLLAWQERRLPMIDLEALLAPGAKRTAPWRYALVLAWQAAPGAPVQQGAIALDTLPDLVTVSDTQACAWPADCSARRFALAWFDFGGSAVPILDTGRLFGGRHG